MESIYAAAAPGVEGKVSLQRAALATPILGMGPVIAPIYPERLANLRRWANT